MEFWPMLLPGGCAALAEGRAGFGAWCVHGAAWCGLGAQNAALPLRRAGQKNLVRQKCATVRCWCCQMMLRCARRVPWCARIVHQQNAALPSRRAGQCFHFDVPSSNPGRNTRYLISLAFLAPNFPTQLEAHQLDVCSSSYSPLKEAWSCCERPDFTLATFLLPTSMCITILPCPWQGQGSVRAGCFLP
ncbi:uncharacterized protein DS421_4g121680 [Arachis hypogaea]|nr:uncharacterized protein DS421_4g121680 [Arachis hypogaea]